MFKFILEYSDMKEGYCMKFIHKMLWTSHVSMVQGCAFAQLFPDYPEDRPPIMRSRDEVWAGSFFLCWAPSCNQLCSLSNYL